LDGPAVAALRRFGDKTMIRTVAARRHRFFTLSSSAVHPPALKWMHG
jgi:hypothetical protein